jgi:hypothetical protein
MLRFVAFGCLSTSSTNLMRLFYHQPEFKKKPRARDGQRGWLFPAWYLFGHGAICAALRWINEN